MTAKEAKENILAQGHENVQATHPSTLMFTKDRQLSKTGDCIIAVAADKAVADLSSDFKEKLKRPNAKLTVIIEVDSLTETINASGSPKLTLTDSVDIVIRKSSYISSRTLAIEADKAAKDLSRKIIEKLKNSQNKVRVTLIVR